MEEKIKEKLKQNIERILNKDRLTYDDVTILERELERLKGK